MNRNTFYAEIFVDELVRAGLRHVVLVPGSRHTPLVLAFAKHPHLTVHSQLDERSAAFYALGIALSTQRPVAIACTSGTAAANFFPAIIEAHQSRVPLLVLTADRPPELRHSGANQTIDQIKLYGDYALWAVDAALPEAEPSAVSIRNLRTLANRAFAKADGIRKGVVHINMPFRKPLEPTPVEGDKLPSEDSPRVDANPFVQIPPSIAGIIPEQMTALADILKAHQNGWIIAGRNLNAEHLGAIAEQINYSILTDTAAQLSPHPLLIRGYETFLQIAPDAFPPPQVVMRFGDLPVSKWLNEYLSAHPPQYYIHISPSGEWSDDNHLVTHFIQADVATLTHALGNLLPASHPENPVEPPLLAVERATWETIDTAMQSTPDFDAAFVYDALHLLPEDSLLFVGNSLPIRHVDQFYRPRNKRLQIFSNRGASGIDGNLSTALGIGAGQPHKPLVAIVGDITFYHDMNGLLAAHRCGVPITIILLNNDGGGIFNRLPIREYDPQFTDYFITPHGLDFTHAAKLYGFDYILAENRVNFREALRACVASGQSTLVEIRTDAKQDMVHRSAIIQSVKSRLLGDLS